MRTGGEIRAALGVEAAGGSSRPLEVVVRGGGSCERYPGVRIAGGTPAARNCRGGRELTSGGAEAIRAERRPEVERGVLRWLPGAEAELMRRFAGAWGRWSGESVAAQCSAPPPEARRRGLGFWGGGGVEMRTREAAGAFIRRRPP